MAQLILPDPEKLGRRRFPDNKDFRRYLLASSRENLNILLNLLPSNYVQDISTNVGVFFDNIARELTRVRLSVNAISNDKFFDLTRPDYLYQVLGAQLFLSGRSAPPNYSDEQYRNYLISIKNAYFQGSKLQTIKNLISEITGFTVNITELFMEARQPGSSVGLLDTHKLRFDVLISDLAPGMDIATMSEEFKYFANLIKPAHVLYDTRFIWTEQIDINKVHDLIFGDTGGGCVPSYDFKPFLQKTYLAQIINVLSVLTPDYKQIDSIHYEEKIFYLTNGAMIVVTPDTAIFDTNGRTINFSQLQIGQYIKLDAIPIPGDFQFWWLPPSVAAEWGHRFYNEVLRRPAFQENVKKLMDSKGRFPQQTKTTPTTLCDRWVQDLMDVQYEDLRKFCGDGTQFDKSYTITLAEHFAYPKFSWPWPHNQITDNSLFGDDYLYQMPFYPLTDGAGGPAEPSDIRVQFDGTSTTGIVSSVDAATGQIWLTDSSSFWDSTFGKYPSTGDSFGFQYYYANLVDTTASTTIIYNDNSRFDLPFIPLSDGTGEDASNSSITVSVNNIALLNSVIYVDSEAGHVYLNSAIDWSRAIGDRSDRSSLIDGDTIKFDYFYKKDIADTLTDTTAIFGISYFQMPQAPLVDSTGQLASPSDITVSIDSTQVSNAVISVRPLLGHVTLNDLSSFWISSELQRVPQIGDTVEFSFYRGFNWEYVLFTDDNARGLDGGFVLDGDGLSENIEMEPVLSKSPLEIGYRYRAYLLQHTSVLNSPDTLLFNNFQKPAQRASLINQQDSLNHLNLFFSPEFLYDKNPIEQLDDAYLENGLDPILKLREGTPPFQKTFGYQPGLVHQRKLQDIRKHHSPLLYSDLVLKEFIEGEDDVPLSSICDSQAPRFKIRMSETIPHIKECPDWLLLDTYEQKEVEVDLPEQKKGIANLRVAGKKLRQNFILRDMEGTGIHETSFTTEADYGQTMFQLPEEIQITVHSELTEIDGTPILKDELTLADPVDITVQINGITIPNAVSVLDPITGALTLATPVYPRRFSLLYTLSLADIAHKAIILPEALLDFGDISVSIIRGTSQYIDLDFYIAEDRSLRWDSLGLDSVLAVGDRLQIQYEARSVVKFTYFISSTKYAKITNIQKSRILDSHDVLPGLCPDYLDINITNRFFEYINFLSDYAQGIKYQYFNKDTHQIEEHVFTGPLFEIYDASLDEIGSPESFQDALVKIPSLPPADNPLSRIGSFSFIDDELVRFRKKTFKELLPNRTFRTTEITEIMPV